MWACAWQGNTTRTVLKKINFGKLSVVRDPKGGTVKQCRRIYTYTFAHKVFAYNFPLWTQTLSIIYEFPSSTCFLYVGFFLYFIPFIYIYPTLLITLVGTFYSRRGLLSNMAENLFVLTFWFCSLSLRFAMLVVCVKFFFPFKFAVFLWGTRENIIASRKIS